MQGGVRRENRKAAVCNGEGASRAGLRKSQRSTLMGEHKVDYHGGGMDREGVMIPARTRERRVHAENAQSILDHTTKPQYQSQRRVMQELTPFAGLCGFRPTGSCLRMLLRWMVPRA